MNEIFDFVSREGAVVEYQRHYYGAVNVTIDRYWFTREAWDELTAELFPPALYTIDADVWLP